MPPACPKASLSTPSETASAAPRGEDACPAAAVRAVRTVRDAGPPPSGLRLVIDVDAVGG